MIKIKVCGMKDPVNVKEISYAWPDYLGFIFWPGSPRYVGDHPPLSLFQNVPPDIVKAGVFVNENQENILDIAQRAGLGMIQLHGNESPEYCWGLMSSGLEIVKSFNIGENFDFDRIKSFLTCCDYFLFDEKSEKPGGSGRKFKWDQLTDYRLEKPFFLSGGIGPEDAGLIKEMDNNGLFAVDINSRFEISPGIKDVAMVKGFSAKLKNSQI